MKKSLTVHHVTPHFFPEIGGLEDSVGRFATWLVTAGHRVVVHTSATSVTGEHLPDHARIGGVEVERYFPVNRAGYFRTWFRPRIEEGDIVHLHGYAIRTNDYVARTVRSIPFVYSLHHGVGMPHPRHHRLFRTAYDYFRGIPTLQSAATILVANPSDSEWLERHGIPKTRIRHLPTPLPDEAFTPGDPRRGQSLAGANRFILYLGRLETQKGVADLLAAVARIPECRLVYAGPDAGTLSSLRRQAHAQGMSQRVSFLGLVTEEDKRALLAACCCLALPSSYEAQGLVVLEAWAQSRPVVATRVGALSRLVEDGGNGILVPFGDVEALAGALRLLWNRPAEGNVMGQRGRSVAERYRLDILGPNLEAVYERLVSP